MRLIDADELMEHVYRDKLDSRELIAQMVENAPTVKEVRTSIPLDIFERLLSLEQDSIRLIEKEEQNLIEIGHVDPGTTVEACGIQLNVLDTAYRSVDDQVGILCLAKDILFEKTFDKGNNNNWETSSLRKYLNSEYLASLDEEFIGALIPFERNLLTDDGMKDYGTCVDKISLISEREYQEYREYISDRSNYWWTLTALSAKPDNSSCARLVYTDGCFGDGYAHGGYCGVSPAFLLKPDFKVKITENEVIE